MTWSPGSAVSLSADRIGHAVGEVGVGRVAEIVERQHGEPHWARRRRAARVVRPPGEEHADADEKAECRARAATRSAIACRRAVARRPPERMPRRASRSLVPLGGIERRGEVPRRREPVRGNGSERLPSAASTPPAPRARTRRTEGASPGILLATRLRRRARERRLPGQHLVEHGAQGVDVGRAHRASRSRARLLGTHVRRRADRHSGLGERRARRWQLRRERPRDAEVGDQGVPCA